jgi:hypothetical protein
MTRIDDTKLKSTATEAIEFAFGVPPTVLHQRWREWMLERGKKK